jgi:hypothetical protein
VKTIKVQLGSDSIKAAIKEIKDYKQEVKRKTKELLNLMVAHGEDYAINSVSHIDTGGTLSSIHGYRKGKVGVIVAGGNAIWLEFGTGVKNNGSAGGSPHPKGDELGMVIGGYGSGHGADPNGWWYFDDGTVKHTYGIKATQFMWKTALELQKVAPELAREVFSR